MTQTVAIIGAASSGLTAARHFIVQDFEVEVLEREDNLGGNWHYGKACSRVYRSTHTISSKPGTEFPDFPKRAKGSRLPLQHLRCSPTYKPNSIRLHPYSP